MTISLKYPKGSEWRRWDLHVHTPYSALNNGFGADFESYAETLFRKALEREIAVIGVTDYFLVEGYERLRQLQRDLPRLSALMGVEAAEKVQGLLLLPNIEFRLSVHIGNKKVNFHVLFSDELDPETINEHFLRELRFTAEASVGTSNQEWSVTRTNLEELGRQLKAHHQGFSDQSDLFVGMDNAVVAHEKITEVFERQQSRFKDKYLLIIPPDEHLSKLSWDGGGHQTRKILLQKAHMFFSSNPSTRDFGLGKKHASPHAFIDEFKSFKPCIHGSDSHTYTNLFEPDLDRYLWIRSDPTFLGLRQLLHEPEARVYIGVEPESLGRVNQASTKYLREVFFERTSQAQEGINWFSGSIPLSSGLIAIIGNKGSGKSALADILGLLGDSQAYDHFQFLDKDHFLQGKAMLGGMFRASARWHSGRIVPRLLDEKCSSKNPELVKYLPQRYLESICSDLKKLQESAFYRELMDVIFSHVADADRLGQSDLPALIKYLTEGQEQAIAQLVAELNELNTTIAAAEQQLTTEYRDALAGKLIEREGELKAHEDARPVEAPEPTQDTEQQEGTAKVKEELAELVLQIQELDTSIASATDGLKASALRVAAADRLRSRIKNLVNQIENFYNESLRDSDTLAIDIQAVVKLVVEEAPISLARTLAETERERLEAELSPTTVGSIVSRRREISEKASSVRENLDAPNRRYQEYLRQLAHWQERRSQIEGSTEAADSVMGLREQLAAIDAVPTRLAQLKEGRTHLVRRIFQAKSGLLEDYKRLYGPVQDFIGRHPVSQRQGALEFAASIGIEGFEDGILAMIHQGKRGSFQGEQEGRRRLRELVERGDFTTEGGIEEFLQELETQLEFDCRSDEKRFVGVQNQTKDKKTSDDVYNFLYSLTYFRPRFELRWQGKQLDQLSPGERGTLLLVFYLLIDKRDTPLIIDQPEENLDNQTVTAMVVPALKDAKERRQIIMVTHNPNLAVVCDADQIVHAAMDKADGNRVTYTCGAIEDPHITQLIVDVLEGTKPAFDLRGAKYSHLGDI